MKFKFLLSNLLLLFDWNALAAPIDFSKITWKVDWNCAPYKAQVPESLIQNKMPAERFGKVDIFHPQVIEEFEATQQNSIVLLTGFSSQSAEFPVTLKTNKKAYSPLFCLDQGPVSPQQKEYFGSTRKDCFYLVKTLELKNEDHFLADWNGKRKDFSISFGKSNLPSFVENPLKKKGDPDPGALLTIFRLEYCLDTDAVTKKTIYEGSCTQGYPLACNSLGVQLQTQNDLAGASKFYERGCTLKDFESCSNLGFVEFKSGHLDRAVILWNQACGGNHADACKNLAVIEKDKNNPQKALAYLQKACKLGSKEACSALKQ